MVFLVSWVNHEADVLFYALFLWIFEYLIGFYQFSQISRADFQASPRARSFLMTLICFFASCSNWYSAHTFGYAYLGNDYKRFIETCWTGILADLDTVQ